MCRLSTLVRAVVVGLVSCTCASVRAAPAPFLGPIIEVTDEIGGFVNTFAEHGYSMHDGSIVWRDDANKLYLYTGTTPPTQIGESGQPAIFGDKIAISSNGLTLYDIPTAIEAGSIGSGNVFDRAVIHGNRIAWQGFGGPEGQGVFLFDGSTARKIAESELNYDPIALDHQRLAWVATGQQFSIYDLATGQISTRSGPGRRPAVSGEHLVFEGTLDNPGVFLHDLAAPPGDPLRIAPVGYGVSIDGGRVVYSGVAGQLHLYIISTGETIPLGVTGYDPIISGNYLAWGDGVDLFITTIPEPAAILPLVCLVVLRRRPARR